MDKFKVCCIKDVPLCFEKGKEYEVFWDGDGYNEPRSLLATDERGYINHIIAENTLEDDWFVEHFSTQEKEAELFTEK